MKMKLLLFAGLIIGSIGLSFLLSDNLYAKSETIQTSPIVLFAADLGTTDEPAADAEQPASSCRVEGIGWIVCPVAKEASKFVDAAYGFVSSLLKVQPLTTTGEQANIYNAWTIMRNFANVAFVIAFMVIIFSQLTSVGLNNYGIKKMLPRLIVAAILVNASFWICAIAVDISNILGSSINSIFLGMEAGLPSDDGEQANNFSNVIGGSAPGWEGITGLVLAGGTVAALYVGLSALLPALLAALLAIVTVFMVLTLRQALIVLLIIVSPLAFVAYLLPNTESLYKKWLGLFKTLLLMYPIIAAIFGASALASNVVMSTADGEYEIAIQIMGALIAFIPLALTPIVMKTAGGLLNRFGGVVNNPNKGPFDRMRKGAEGYRKNRQQYRELKAMNGIRTLPGKGFVAKSRTRRGAVLASREGALKDAKTNYIADTAAEKVGDNLFAKQMAGGGRFVQANEGAQNAVVASALAQQKKAFSEDVSNMEALVKVKFKDDPGAALREALAKGDDVQAVAASNLLFKSGGGGVSKFREIIESGEANNSAGLATVADKLRSNITDNHGQYIKQKGADIVQWASGAKDANGNVIAPKLSMASTGALSDNDLAGQHSKSIEKSISQGNVSKVQAARMLGDPRVSANLDSGQKAALQQAIISGAGPAPTTPTTQPAGNTGPIPIVTPQSTPSSTAQSQPAPVILNIPHNTPPNANPSNYRTSPPSSSSGNNVSAGGVILPDNYRQPPTNP